MGMSHQALRAGLLLSMALGSANAAGWFLAVGPAGQVEPWADARVPVQGDLALWLDAGRLPAARKAHGRPAILDGEPVDVWYDASGHGLDLVQGFPKSRPVFPRLRAEASAAHRMCP